MLHLLPGILFWSALSEIRILSCYSFLIRAIAIEKEELGKMWYARWGSTAKRKKELEETIRKNEEKRDEIFKKNDFLYRKIF